jgi:hypothetical protein
MEAEVNNLMGAADEAIWRREGLFTSADVLELNTSLNSRRDSVPLHFSPASTVLSREVPSSQPFCKERVLDSHAERPQEVVYLRLLLKHQWF